MTEQELQAIASIIVALIPNVEQAIRHILASQDLTDETKHVLCATIRQDYARLAAKVKANAEGEAPPAA